MISNEAINELSLDWPALNQHSVVWEVGAYEGRWSTQMYDKYNCTVRAFEPQDWAYDKLLQLAATRPKYHAYNFALGLGDIRVQMGEFGTDACSFLLVGRREQGIVQVRDIDNVIWEFRENIDLMMMNIEGFEYLLLDRMLQCDLLRHIDRLCIQWHTFADHDSIAYHAIKGELSKTHKVLWSHYPALECYIRNELEV